ncbi:MAG: hypothetical protein QM541_08360 [Flavobacterium sp.]|nr:hypothetical protein [Flavobacterium sp.]
MLPLLTKLSSGFLFVQMAQQINAQSAKCKQQSFATDGTCQDNIIQHLSLVSIDN